MAKQIERQHKKTWRNNWMVPNLYSNKIPGYDTFHSGGGGKHWTIFETPTWVQTDQETGGLLELLKISRDHPAPRCFDLLNLLSILDIIGICEHFFPGLLSVQALWCQSGSFDLQLNTFWLSLSDSDTIVTEVFFRVSFGWNMSRLLRLISIRYVKTY